MSDLREAANKALDIICRLNIGDNIERWYQIAPLAKKMANQLLVDYQADDDVHADLPWLNSLWRENGKMDMICVRLCDDREFHLVGHSDWVSPYPATRGDVRRLCKALGVELKDA